MYLFILCCLCLWRVKCEDCMSPRNTKQIQEIPNTRRTCCSMRTMKTINVEGNFNERRARERERKRAHLSQNVCRKVEMRPYGYILLLKTWHFMNYVKSTWMSLSRVVFFLLLLLLLFTPSMLGLGQCVVMARQRQQPLFISAFLQFIRIQLNRCILTFFFVLFHLSFDHFSFENYHSVVCFC